MQKNNNNSQPNQSKMSSTQVNQRELYRITRSEATELVAMYMNARKKSADGSIEPERVFRDALETAKPAYIGKYNNSREGKFYKIALDLYNILNELNRRAAETNHHEKTMDAAKLLPCKHSIAYLTATFLNWAVYNWHMKKEPIVEDLGDNGYEYNRCTICDYEGDSLFYFSTAYGLDNPICEYCLPFDANDYEEEEAEYEMEEESETGTSEAEASETGANEEEASEEASDAEDSDDEDYEPSNESEDEKEEDDEDDMEEDDEDDMEEDDEDDMEEDDEDDEEAEHEEASGDEEEQSFGCTGCPYEWRAGFKHGYKTAMKEMRNYANQQKRNIPEIPECEVCGDSHEKLKKCGRCKLVRYCSEECQTEDWAEHRHICEKA